MRQMQIFRSIAQYKEYLSQRKKERSIGFVPTMGYLHDGHISLVERAKRENDVVVMSIFVNPLQFGPNEDFERYPRDEARDLHLMEQAGVDAAFLPTVSEMYPNGPVKSKVTVSDVTERLCGASRPGHFDGVATVVMKLFHIIEPDRAYFGMKDAQQVAVIEQMTGDLNVPVSVVPCPTLREADGLAMSSRNVYLTTEERMEAPVLHRSLAAIDGWLEANPLLTASELEQLVIATIKQAPSAGIDYVQVLSYPALAPIEGPLREAGAFITALAVKFGRTRLIDNRLFSSAIA
jgi:pantoate--beta-alanine ligase